MITNGFKPSGPVKGHGIRIGNYFYRLVPVCNASLKRMFQQSRSQTFTDVIGAHPQMLYPKMRQLLF